MNTKNPLYSKTNWLNFITGILAVISATDFQHLVPAKYLPFILTVNVVGNLILRNFFTNSATTQFAAQKQ
jgi:hypothetical protein